MTNKIIYIIIFTFSFTSCKTEPKTLVLEKNKRDKIEELSNRYLELNRFSGTILVAKEGTVVYNASFGLADYENNIEFSNKTAFKVGEIKQLVSVAIIKKLVKQDEIQLTDKLSKHLTEVKTNGTISDALKQNVNIDDTTLIKLIETISQKSFRQNIDDFSKYLELENTYINKTDSNNAVGYLYHNYQGKGLELQKVPAIVVENKRRNNELRSTVNDVFKILKYNATELNLDGYLENDGFSYAFVNDTVNNTSIIILSNRRHPVAKEISNSITAILKGKTYQSPLPRKPFGIDKTSLKDFAGVYAINENAQFEVVHSNDSLLVLLGPNKIHLVPQSANQFYMQDQDASMRFLKDTMGGINKIKLLNGFIDSDQQANRIK